MKEKKTADELVDMIAARMTVQATVAVTGRADNWVAGTATWGGVEAAAEADRQAKEIVAELREKYELADD